MAQQIGLSPTTLSHVINGKKKLSEKKGLEVSKKLKLNSKEAKYFQTLVHYENTQDENLRRILECQLKTLNPILLKSSHVEDENYIVLSEWHHIAILELTYVNQKKLNAKIVSEQLNIELDQAESALNLLEKLGLLQPKNSSYEKTKKQFIFSSELSNLALRQYHKTMLGKAQWALIEQTNKEKIIGSETFPLALEDLNQAREIIENCFQQLIQLSESSVNRKHVYHAGIQMFQLSRRVNTESSNDVT
jgi:uncharacterized protein (TIGR02147 family)